MHGIVDLVYQHTPRDEFTDTELQGWLPDSAAARYGRVKRALAKGDIVHVRRGLYVLGARYRRRPLELFALAQNIYGPSSISLESALSFHGWIPEAVRTVTSVTPLRSAEFRTPAGPFSYATAPGFSFYTQVERRQTGDAVFFMAKPLRALFDYVHVRKLDVTHAAPLLENLRIDAAELAAVQAGDVGELTSYFKSRRIDKFAAVLGKEVLP